MLLDTWYNLACSLSGDPLAAVSGGPTVFTLDPQVNFVGGDECTLTVLAASVTDQDTIDPPDGMAADFTMNFSVVDVCILAYIPAFDHPGQRAVPGYHRCCDHAGVVVGDDEGPSPSSARFLPPGSYR